MAIALLTTRSGGPNDPIAAIIGSLAILPAITVGAILVTRLPANPIGWLLLVGGLTLVANGAASGLADYGLNVHPGSVPGAVWFAWLNAWCSLPVVVLAGVYLPLLFPTGRLQSPRWRVVAIAGGVGGAIATLQSALSAFTPGTFPQAVQNPLLLSGSAGDLVSALGGVASAVMFGSLLLAVASLVLRYRRSGGIERQQLKWVAAVIGIAIAALTVAVLTSGATSGVIALVSNVAWAIAGIGLGLLPIAIGVAILRYRLYDIDRLISRTLVYGLLAALLALVYGGSILLLTALLAPLTAENSLAVAGSTLLVAALFTPVRNRVRSIVDQRFYRSRYDAARELAELSQRLRGQVDLDGVKAEVVATVGRTLAPASASIWLRPSVIASNPDRRRSTSS